MGESEGRMRFVPVLPEFNTGAGYGRDRIFRAIVALLQGGIQLSGSPWCHAPAVFRTERAD
jgi:hypothetical protein